MKFQTWGAMAVTLGATFVAVGACGGGDGASSGAGGAGGTGSVSSSKATSASSVTSSSSGCMPMPGCECKTGDPTTCNSCCAMDFKPSYDAFAAVVLANCACTPGAICEVECANDACKMMPPSQTCATCVNTKGAMAQAKCYTDAVMKCMADMTCTEFLKCTGTYCAP